MLRVEVLGSNSIYKKIETFNEIFKILGTALEYSLVAQYLYIHRII